MMWSITKKIVSIVKSALVGLIDTYLENKMNSISNQIENKSIETKENNNKLEKKIDKLNSRIDKIYDLLIKSTK